MGPSAWGCNKPDSALEIKCIGEFGLRIALISSKYPPEYAGSGLRAHNTYQRLMARFEIDLDVYTNSVDRNGNESYEIDGILVHRFGRTSRSSLGTHIPVLSKVEKHARILTKYFMQGHPTWKHLKDKDYDLIHTFGDSVSVQVAMYFAKRHNVPVIREICNTPTALRPTPLLPFYLHRLMPYSYPANARLVAISPGIRDNLLSAGISSTQIWQRPNPVDESIYSYDRSSRNELRDKLTPFSTEDRVILSVAKFMPRKNQIFLVECLRHLPQHFKLLLRGPMVTSGPFAQRDADYVESIQSRIREYGLEDRVVLQPGFVDDVASLYKLADVFAFPSLEDALGTPMLESIACGTPVVANYLPGVTDAWIESGTGGFVCHSDPDPVKPGYQQSPDSQDFASCLERASLFAEEIRQEASARILAQASTAIIDRSYWELFEFLVQETKTQRRIY